MKKMKMLLFAMVIGGSAVAQTAPVTNETTENCLYFLPIIQSAYVQYHDDTAVYMVFEDQDTKQLIRHLNEITHATQKSIRYGSFTLATTPRLNCDIRCTIYDTTYRIKRTTKFSTWLFGKKQHTAAHYYYNIYVHHGSITWAYDTYNRKNEVHTVRVNIIMNRKHEKDKKAIAALEQNINVLTTAVQNGSWQIKVN